MGFVNCDWALKGVLKKNVNSRIIADGNTFDNKLYTFQEMDYKNYFEFLNIFVKRHVEKRVENLPSTESVISVLSSEFVIKS